MNRRKKPTTRNAIISNSLQCLADAIKANEEWRDADAGEVTARRAKFTNIAAVLLNEHAGLLTEALNSLGDSTNA